MPYIPFAELRQIEASAKGKTLTWEESYAPLSDDPDWHACSGKIKAISRKNDGYYVSNSDGTSHWVLSVNVTQRNIKLEGE